MTWDKELPGCFGIADLIFALDPSDEDRAFQWLTSLRDRTIGWGKARQQIIDFLTSKKARAEHIAEQVERAELRMQPWLLD